MKLLLYSNGMNGALERLLVAISDITPTHGTEICQTAGSLQWSLRQPRSESMILLLCLSSREKLEELLPLESLLQGNPIIIILPDREKETLAKALTLRPRFFSFTDTDFSDVHDVLARLLVIHARKTWDFAAYEGSPQRTSVAQWKP